MQHEVLKKSLSGCSANKSVSLLEGFPAFSLGEMLLVLLIMSFLAISIPGVHFKKSELKTKRTLHGRYECYYACPLITEADGSKRHLSGCTDSEYSLYQYSVNEDGAATGPEIVTKCEFTPPSEAIFYLVHAVGGGGGSSTTNGSATVTTNTYSQTYTTPNAFPKWLRDVQGANQLPSGSTGGAGSRYNTTVSGSYAIINYGRSGKSGDTSSLFFPRLRNVVVEMYPGKGGARGSAGTKTEVYFNTVSTTGGNKRTKVIEAAGGGAGSGSGTMRIWLDGDTAMCAVKDNDDVGFREADFATNVELDKGSLMESKMEEVKFGSGGAGSYGNVTTAGTVSYYVNSVNVSAYVKKLNCNDPTMCGNGSTSNPCPGQAGRNGAVVILW